MKHYMVMQKYVLLFTLACLALLHTGCASAPKWLKGKWEGVGDQVDGQTWKVALDATKLRNIHIDYPDLDCGGKWKLVETAGKGAKVLEQLTYGLDKCDNNVEVVLERLPEGTVKVMYYLKAYSPEAIATAVLSKAD